MDWLNPVCHRPVYNEATWDLDRCFQETALTLLPNVVLAVIGGTEFPALWRRYRRGERERLPKEGKAAYAVKLVRSFSSCSPDRSPLAPRQGGKWRRRVEGQSLYVGGLTVSLWANTGSASGLDCSPSRPPRLGPRRGASSWPRWQLPLARRQAAVHALYPRKLCELPAISDLFFGRLRLTGDVTGSGRCLRTRSRRSRIL
jgi:hypothetical protein